MHKKIAALLTVLLLAVLLFGCGKKQDLSPEEFQKIAESYNFTVEEVTEDFAGEVEMALIAYNEKDSAQVEYYRVYTSRQAEEAFAENREVLEEGEAEKKSGDRWAGVLEEEYQVVSVADRTFVYAYCDNNETEEKRILNSFLKAIGY